MNKKYILLPIGLVFVLFMSCCFLGSKSTKTEPVYTPEVVWTLETKTYETWAKMTQIDGFLYLIESNFISNNVQEKKYFQLSKINPANGQYVWKSEIINKPEGTLAVKCMGKIYVHSELGYLICFDDSTGNLLATVKIGSDDKTALRNSVIKQYFISYNNCLYWGNRGYDNSGGVDPLGLMRFDINNINFSDDPNAEQILLPQLIWEAPVRHVIWDAPIENNGIIYFLTQNPDYPYDGTSDLVAIDAVTEEVKWKYNQNIFKGLANNALIIHGEKLYVVDSSLGCYNINTGEKYFEIDVQKQDLKKEVCISNSSYSAGIFFYDDKLYYTTQASWATPGMTEIPRELAKNIMCVDADNGQFLWGDMPEGGGSLDTRPITANGKTYVVSDMGLRVYDADSGKLLGVDKTVKNFGRQPNALYNDLVIYLNDNKEALTATLTAIRAN